MTVKALFMVRNYAIAVESLPIKLKQTVRKVQCAKRPWW